MVIKNEKREPLPYCPSVSLRKNEKSQSNPKKPFGIRNKIQELPLAFWMLNQFLIYDQDIMRDNTTNCSYIDIIFMVPSKSLVFLLLKIL